MSITSENTKEDSYLEYPKNEEEEKSGSNFEFLKELTKSNYVFVYYIT